MQSVARIHPLAPLLDLRRRRLDRLIAVRPAECQGVIVYTTTCPSQPLQRESGIGLWQSDLAKRRIHPAGL